MNSSMPGSKKRFNTWLITEKVIGWILLLWSIFVLYNIILVINNAAGAPFAVQAKLTYGNLLLKNHLTLIISALCLFGSCLLLFTDRPGWILCVIASLLYGIILFLSARAKADDNTLPMAEYYKSYGIVALLFLLMFVLLILKPIRSRYFPTIKTWSVIAAAILLFIVDRLIF